MSDFRTTCSESMTCEAKVPWVTFGFLAAMFFLAQQQLFLSLEEDFGGSVDVVARAAAQGNLSRRVVFLALGFFGAFSLMRKDRNRLRINGVLGWLILFYLAWAFLSLAWADNTVLTFRRLVVLSTLSLGALAVAGRFSLNNITLFIFFSAILYLLIGFFAEIAFGTFRPFGLGYRFAGTLHPNHQGINCALLLLSGVAAAQAVNRGRTFYLVCALIGLTFLVLTRSRTAFASVILTLFVYWNFVFPTSRKSGLVLYVAMFLSPVLLLVGDVTFLALQGVVLLGRQNPYTFSLTGRIPLWEVCISYIAKRPFLGYGYNGFWTPSHIVEISAVQGWGIAVGHSAYLDLLLGLGPIGMVSYLLILIVGSKRSFSYYRASLNTAYASLGALLFFCMLDGLLESAVLNATLLTFLSMVALARLAFQEP